MEPCAAYTVEFWHVVRIYRCVMYRSKRAGCHPVILTAVLLFTCPIALADQPKFEPGALLVGYEKPTDRDHAVSVLASIKDVVRIRGGKLEEVRVEIVSDKTVKLRFKFPDSVLSATRNEPGLELGLLRDLARQLKQNDPSIRYAHPNWIAAKL
jgi:hypothetical protein